jgi:hypothetical protein
LPDGEIIATKLGLPRASSALLIRPGRRPLNLLPLSVRSSGPRRVSYAGARSVLFILVSRSTKESKVMLFRRFLLASTVAFALPFVAVAQSLGNAGTI